MNHLKAPEGWVHRRLCECADQRTEKFTPAAGDHRPYLALEHLAQGRPALLGSSSAGSATSAKTVFYTGDILFGRLRPNSGSLVFPKRGEAIFKNRVRLLGTKATVDPNLMILTPTAAYVPSFLMYLLIHIGLFNLSDNSAIPQLNNKHLYPFTVSSSTNR